AASGGVAAVVTPSVLAARPRPSAAPAAGSMPSSASPAPSVHRPVKILLCQSDPRKLFSLMVSSPLFLLWSCLLGVDFDQAGAALSGTVDRLAEGAVEPIGASGVFGVHPVAGGDGHEVDLAEVEPRGLVDVEHVREP